MLKPLLIILLSSVLVNNYVLNKFLGICPFLGVSKKVDQATGMGLAVIFVMLVSTAATWPIQTYLLDQYDLGYMQTIIFILVIAALVQLVEMILKKFIPPLYESLGIYLPLITTNCAVLGVAITVVTKEFTFGGEAHLLNLGEATVYALATSLGYGLAMCLFAGIREHLALGNVPKAFRGLPIALISVSIMAMAFLGFSGLVK